MFGSNAEKQSHEKKLSRIAAKTSVISEVLKNSDINKTVYLKDHILKLAFILEVRKESVNDKPLTRIKYLNFNNINDFSDDLYREIAIYESEMSFDEITQAIKDAK